MSAAIDARQFLRSTRSGVLSTVSAKFDGYPFGSVAPFVLDHAGAPIILISTLAEHTKNILVNPKVSLLVFAGAEDLHANARLTLMGNCVAADKSDALLRARYLRYFPAAIQYFDMHDFSFYRIQITQARYIGGFGKISWVEGSALCPSANQLAELETGMIAHMNADHADSLIAYCQHYHQLAASHAEMLGVDTDGFDVKATLASPVTGGTGQAEIPAAVEKILRFQFEQPVTDAQSARAALVAMSKATRA